MRRADRLFQILQILRRDRITTGAALAAELGVSVRTVYRDVAVIQGSGVPIEGEAGTGYRLPRHFDLPPLMFTVDELEALMAGARIVEAWGDAALSEAARLARGKVEAAVPQEVRRRLAHSTIHAPDYFIAAEGTRFLGVLRLAMRNQNKVRMLYRKEDGTENRRTVWPLGLFFWGSAWTLAAWCELREAFRTFRVDRVQDLETLPDRFPSQEGKSLQDFIRQVKGEATANRS